MNLLFFSCERHDSWQKIVLPQTFMFKGSYKYMVPKEQYLRIFAEKNTHSNVVQVVRMGKILFIKGFDVTDSEGYRWIQVADNSIKGWVLVYDPIVCYSYDQAVLFSNRLRKQ